MAAYKKYYGKNIGIRYFPEENVIYLEPKKGLSKSDLRQVKEKMETFLTVDSTNFTKNQGKPGFSIKLSDQSPIAQVEELLRQMFHGGDQVEDAASLMQQDDEEEEEQEEQNPQQQQMQPQMPQQQPMGMPENFYFVAYEILTESTYRTAEYWDTLSRASGRGKQAIDDKTVLSLRRTYTRKPRGKRRDEVLRSLDQAMKYFARRMRKQIGEDAARQFKEKYRSIGDLVPSDYSDTTEKHLPTGGREGNPFTTSGAGKQAEEPEQESKEEMNLDFSEFFSTQEEEDEEDAYEGFETQE